METSVFQGLMVELKSVALSCGLFLLVVAVPVGMFLWTAIVASKKEPPTRRHQCQ